MKRYGSQCDLVSRSAIRMVGVEYHQTVYASLLEFGDLAWDGIRTPTVTESAKVAFPFSQTSQAIHRQISGINSRVKPHRTSS